MAAAHTLSNTHTFEMNSLYATKVEVMLRYTILFLYKTAD